MQCTVRNLADRQEVGTFPGHIELALDVSGAHSHEGIGWIGNIGAIHDKEIAVEIRLKRFGGQCPNTLVIFGHRQRLFGPIAIGLHLFGVRCAQAERHLSIRTDNGRDDLRCGLPRPNGHGQAKK